MQWWASSSETSHDQGSVEMSVSRGANRHNKRAQRWRLQWEREEKGWVLVWIHTAIPQPSEELTHLHAAYIKPFDFSETHRLALLRNLLVSFQTRELLFFSVQHEKEKSSCNSFSYNKLYDCQAPKRTDWIIVFFTLFTNACDPYVWICRIWELSK